MSQSPKRLPQLFKLGACPWLLAICCVCAGCSDSGPPMSQVTGKVLFKDGTIPKGAQTIVTFRPAPDSEAEVKKGAGGSINPDGTYDVFTMKPGDGVYYGKYKVIFAITGDYRSGDATAVDPKYTSIDTTPYEIVVDEPTEHFDFEIEKPSS